MLKFLTIPDRAFFDQDQMNAMLDRSDMVNDNKENLRRKTPIKKGKKFSTKDVFKVVDSEGASSTLLQGVKK